MLNEEAAITKTYIEPKDVTLLEKAATNLRPKLSVNLVKGGGQINQEVLFVSHYR